MPALSYATKPVPLPALHGSLPKACPKARLAPHPFFVSVLSIEHPPPLQHLPEMGYGRRLKRRGMLYMF